jgi:hypothetical protein
MRSLGGRRAALHGDAGREQDQVGERRSPAGPGPVHHHRALPGEQDVVGADVRMQQRVASRVIGPGCFQVRQLVQVDA